MRALAAILVAPLALGCLAALPASAQSVQERLPTCLACHGEKGQSATPDVPSLGAQQKDYALTQLYMFREKLRNVELMTEMTKGLSDDDLRVLAETIAKLPSPPPSAGAEDAARVARAKALIDANRCNFCHAANFAGQDQVPRLAGQREDYLVKSLREYKSGSRPGYDPAMASVVEPLQDRDFADIAYYLGRQP